MSRYGVIIYAVVEAEDAEDAERRLVHELLPWENIDTADAELLTAIVEPESTVRMLAQQVQR